MLPTAGLQVGGQLVKRATGGQAHYPLGGRVGGALHLSPGTTVSSPVPLTRGKPPMVPAVRVQGDVMVAVET